MPTTVALVPLTHPDSGNLVAAGDDITLGDEDYALLRSEGKVAASAAEQKAHATADAEGNYSARAQRPGGDSVPPVKAPEPINAPAKDEDSKKK